MTDYELLESLKEARAVTETQNPQPNVIAALDRVISIFTPKKPTGAHTNCRCPVCGRRVRSGQGSSSLVRDKRCQDCGQILDWEAQNEI